MVSDPIFWLARVQRALCFLAPVFSRRSRVAAALRARTASGARLAASLGGPPSDVFSNALITDAETQP
eukprot:2390446-Prymnesium_polylepis.1